MKVIDFRFRPPTPEFKSSLHGLVDASKGSTGGRIPPGSVVMESYWDADLAGCVREMEEAGVIGVMPGRGAPPPLAISNDHLQGIVTQYPGRFVPIAGIDPTKPKACQQEVDRIAKMGFKGVHFDPGYLVPRMLPNDPRMYPIYDLCSDLRQIVILQIGPRAGYDLDEMSPVYIDKLARDFPSLQIVIAHGCWPLIDEMVAVLWKRPNVWLSPDNYQFRPLGSRYVEIVNHDSPIQDRYLYGSAYPFGKGIKATIDEWMKFAWRDSIVEKLLYGNAATLLGLS